MQKFVKHERNDRRVVDFADVAFMERAAIRGVFEQGSIDASSARGPRISRVVSAGALPADPMAVLLRAAGRGARDDERATIASQTGAERSESW